MGEWGQWLKIFAMCAGLCAPYTAAFAQEGDAAPVILVIDGSGSMWGQVDGRAKIEIARGVVDGLLETLPGDRELGLMAYGHRRRGDCDDIEMMVPVGTDHDAIRGAMSRINPKGKTPLSDAVRQAAGELAYQDRRAIVILVSDGEETCGMDPCATGAELEAAGLDFTAHVIGFNVADREAQAQLICLAENTGGRYFPASDADDLAEALEETVLRLPELEGASLGRLTLAAARTEEGDPIDAALRWYVRNAQDEIVFQEGEAGVTDVEVPPGVYDIFVEDAISGLRASVRDLEVPPAAELDFLLVLSRDDLEATVAGPVQAEPGSLIEVTWSGPDFPDDYVAISELGARDAAYESRKFATEGSPITLGAPVRPGLYEIRYVSGLNKRILARQELDVH